VQSLVRPARGSLNRSLTRAEAALQLALNRKLGASGDVFALRLGNRLSDVPPDPPRISAGVARGILERHGPALDRIDALLPLGEPLAREIQPDARGPLTLTEAQMAVIAEGIAARVRPTMRTRILRIARQIRRRGSL